MKKFVWQAFRNSYADITLERKIPVVHRQSEDIPTKMRSCLAYREILVRIDCFFVKFTLGQNKQTVLRYFHSTSHTKILNIFAGENVSN